MMHIASKFLLHVLDMPPLLNFLILSSIDVVNLTIYKGVSFGKISIMGHLYDMIITQRFVMSNFII